LKAASARRRRALPPKITPIRKPNDDWLDARQ
jgi:hypothetical protein